MDRIILLKGGEIIFNETFEQIQKENFYLNLLKETVEHEIPKIEIENIIEENIEELKLGQEIKKLTLEEDEEIGSVKLYIYDMYARYMGGKLFLFLIFIVMCVWQSAKSGSSLWISYWSKDENKEKDPNSKWEFFLFIHHLMVVVYFSFF